MYMLHRTYAYLDVPGSYARIIFFDFSGAFNTIRPPILKDKLLGMGVAPSLASWIIDYMTARPQIMECGVGAPQGTVGSFSFPPVHIGLQVQLRVLPHTEVF